MKKTFVNRFHNASVRLDVQSGKFLTVGQVRKLEKALCGMPDCDCNMYPVLSDDNSMIIYRDGTVYDHGSLEVL